MIDIEAISNLSISFLKEAEGKDEDINELLMDIVAKLSDYEDKPEIQLGKEILGMIDSFKHMVANKISNDYIKNWKK